MNFFKQGKTNWKYILIVLILAILVGGGILLWVKIQEFTFFELPELKKPEKVIKDETVELVPSEVEGWKTYRNEEYGFEMKYPEGFFPLEPKTELIQCDYANFADKCPLLERTTINGVPFCREEISGAGLGTTYITHNYTTVRDRECFVVSFIVPYPNCSNLLPVANQETQEAYDKCRLDNEVTTPKTINQILSAFKFIKKDETAKCSSIDFPNYEVYAELKVDLNGDQKEEIVRVYREYTTSDIPTLPIMVKIFSGTKECPKENFSYQGWNEVWDAQVFLNFWGDGTNAVMVKDVSYAGGSGSSVAIRFFTYRNGEYAMIEGPQFGGQWRCCKFAGENGSGEKIIGAESRWAEDYSDYCAGCPSRFQFYIYTWNGKEYIKTEAGTTKNYYSGNIDEILQKEPSVLEEVE